MVRLMRTTQGAFGAPAGSTAPTFGASSSGAHSVHNAVCWPDKAASNAVLNVVKVSNAFAGLFGSSSTGAFSFGASQPASSPSLFGVQSGASTPSLFGAQPASAPSLFGAPAASAPSLFGAQPASAPSLFGAPAASAPLLFGAASAPAFGAAGGFGGFGFGAASAPAAASQPGLFGAPAQPQTQMAPATFASGAHKNLALLAVEPFQGSSALWHLGPCPAHWPASVYPSRCCLQI